jgi:hypothetical protein
MSLHRRCRYRIPVAEGKAKSAGKGLHLVFQDTEMVAGVQLGAGDRLEDVLSERAYGTIEAVLFSKAISLLPRIR